MWLAVIVALILLSVLFYYQWIVGMIATVIVILASIYFVIVYNDDYKIEWINPYVQTLFPDKTLTNQSLTLLSENILRDLEKEQAYSWLYIDDLIYFIQINYEHNILYLFDRTTEKRQEQM